MKFIASQGMPIKGDYMVQLKYLYTPAVAVEVFYRITHFDNIRLDGGRKVNGRGVKSARLFIKFQQLKSENLWA